MAASVKMGDVALNSVCKVQTLDDIRKEIALLSNQEDAITSELDVLVKEQQDIDKKLDSLYKVLPNLSVIQNDSSQLTGMISFTSQLAENVSSKVRQLDLAKSRVLAASLRVEDILDLKFCTEGVQTAMRDESYEQAAALIHRFLSMDESVLALSADATEGSSLRKSFDTLHEAEAKLKSVTNTKFDAAVTAGDAASVERYFKIFPLLGLKEEGLNKFARWLSASISEKSEEKMKLSLSMQSTDKRASVVFSDLLEALFELIAKSIEIHQPLIETKYGNETKKRSASSSNHGGFNNDAAHSTMEKCLVCTIHQSFNSINEYVVQFAQGLQKECDRQARKIIEEFKSTRKFSQLSANIRDSMATSHKPSTSESKYDPKALDILLGELTMMNSKAELYLRFLKRRVTTDMENLGEEKLNESLPEVEHLVRRCDLSKEMQVLIGYYIMMEEYYMREMADKAFLLDTSDQGSLTTSVVDDTFYLVKKSIRRALSSSSIDGVCAVINHACSVLEEKFIDLLKSRLRLGYPSGALSQAYNLVQSSIQQGKLQSSDLERARQQFLLTLNNAEMSSENLQTLKNSIESELPKLLSSDSKHTDEKLESSLTDLGQLTKRFKELLDFGFDQLRTTAIKQRIKPSMESFLSVSHNIDEELFSQYEAEDPWIQAFVVDLDGFLSNFKSLLTPHNYDQFISHLTNELTQQMEKAIFKISFNRLGGLQFDKELRSLLGYLTNVTTWTIRDKFARLTQMATILHLDKVEEMLDYWGSNSGPFTWRLTPSEVRQILALRIDFAHDAIRQLKL